jgi:hypothetical protein
MKMHNNMCFLNAYHTGPVLIKFKTLGSFIFLVARNTVPNKKKFFTTHPSPYFSWGTVCRATKKTKEPSV